MKPPPLIPAWDLWARTWAAVHRQRRRRAAQRARSLPCPVVSIGNLHWGGTGKSPLVASIAALLRDQGWAVCVLSRGYGRKTRGPLVVSRGEGPLVDVFDAGDEPTQLAKQLPGVAVVVAEQRLAGGQLALSTVNPRPTLFLLDDGFSHVALARDLDLLVLPAADPWGGGRLPPAGRLREPIQSVAHADAIVLTGAGAHPGDAEEIPGLLAPWGFAGPAFVASTRSAAPTGSEPNAPPGSMLLVTGIARPERVLASAREQGLDITEHLRFPDHHPYPAASVRRIEERLTRTRSDRVLTTAKDWTKLAGRLSVEVLVLPLSIDLDPGLAPWLIERLPSPPNQPIAEKR